MPEMALSAVKDNAKRILDYITALASFGRRVDDFESEAEWCIYGRHLFTSDDALLPGVELDKSAGELNVWIAVDRLQLEQPPKLPAEGALARWEIKIPDAVNEPKHPQERIFIFASQEEVNRLLADKSGLLHADNVGIPSDDGSVPCRFLWDDDKEAQKEWAAYLENQWHPWQRRESPRRKQMKIYERLHRFCQSGNIGDDSPMEIVFGVGMARGMAQIDDGNRVRVKNPVIEQVAEVKLGDDNNKSRILVYPRMGRRPRIALTSYQDDPNINGVKQLLEDNLEQDDYELNPFDTGTFSPIVQAAQAQLDSEAQYEEDAAKFHEELPEKMTYYPEWAVFIRRRNNKAAINETAEKMKRQIDRITEAGALPDTILRIAGGVDMAEVSHPRQPHSGQPDTSAVTRESSPRPRYYLPLPYNEEQKSVIDALSSSAGIVVQGPPGTGKSHTIANIICHFLATGKRVLVSSHDISALEVLERKIPESIRDLVIPVLADTSEGKKKIETAINKLLGIQGIDGKVINDEITRYERVEAESRADIARAKNDVLHLFARQTESPPDFLMTDAVAFTPQERNCPPAALLARWCGASLGAYSWFMDRPDTTSWDELPFGEEDIARLRDARLRLGEDLRHLGKTLPPDTLPSSADVRDWHDDLHMAARIAERINAGEVRRFAQTDESAVRRAESVKEKLQMMLAAHADAAKVSWVAKIPANENDYYRQRRADIKNLRQRREDADINCVVRHSDPAAIIDNMPVVIKVLEQKAGGKWGMAFFGKKRKIIDGFRTNGQPPQNADEWGNVLAFAKWLADSHKFAEQWNATIAAEIRDKGRAPDVGGIADWLRKTDDAITAAETATRLLQETQPQIGQLFAGMNGDILTDESAIGEVIRHIDENIQRIKCEEANEGLKALAAELGDAEISGEMREFLFDKVGTPDTDGQGIIKEWDVLTREANRLWEKAPDLGIVAEVTALIEQSGAPHWAGKLRQQLPQDDLDNALPEDWRNAWLWGCANAWLESRESGEEIKMTLKQLSEAHSNLGNALGKIVEWRAKKTIKIALDNDAVAAQNMNVFLDAMKRMPKGKDAKKRHRYRLMAARAMEKCYGKIPCWIMPFWQTNEMLPPEMGAFDLVITDESSQGDVKETLALMRGRQVLVVGDDKQVSPTVIIKARDAQALMNRYLLPIPARGLYFPEHSLYDIARGIFPGKAIMLREHFRCAEPIIAFSSREFYDDKIEPLRVPKSTERIMPPLVDVYVRDGAKVGDKNEAEANAIVDEIEKLRDSPETRNRSIGVISLVGHEQARRIYELLAQRLGMDHGVRCGGAAIFQGSEYDIVFLSMVESPPARAWTTNVSEQRFNVAASRARDRLYLYRSVRTEDLSNPADIKLRLIRHFQNPLPNHENKPLAELCESPFEREVYNRLIDKGYAATPQVGSLGYRIDIVVEGENGNRLAVELDGDLYHQDWQKDIARQQTLERVGWHFWRCFFSTYNRDKDGTFQNLLDELESRGIRPWQRGDAATTDLVEHREVIGMPENDNANDAENIPPDAAPPVSDDSGDANTPPDNGENNAATPDDTATNDSDEEVPFALKHQPTTKKLF